MDLNKFKNLVLLYISMFLVYGLLVFGVLFVVSALCIFILALFNWGHSFLALLTIVSILLIIIGGIFYAK